VRLGVGQVASAALACAIVAVAAAALFGEHGAAHLLRLRAERRRLGQATFALMRDNAERRREIDRLRSDDLYLEALARRVCGLVRPNETVYRFRRPPG
jgi:cell division protein FtsB